MEEIFTRANASNKGAAGPKADAELMLHEFLAMIVRVAFFRLNPGYPGADEFTPVPNALRLTLNNCIVPNARTGRSSRLNDARRGIRPVGGSAHTEAIASDSS